MKSVNQNPATSRAQNPGQPGNKTAKNTVNNDLLPSAHTGEVIVYYALNDGNAKVEAIAGNISAFGYTPEEFISGKISLQDIVYDEDIQEVITRSNEHMKNRSENFSYDCRIFDKSGTPVWVTNTVMPTYSPDGEATHFFIRFRHIDHDKQFECLQDDVNENLFDMLKNTGEAVILTDTGGRINQLNLAAERMTGLSNTKARHKLLKGVLRFCSPEDLSITIDPVKVVAGKKSPVQFDEIFMRDHTDGTHIRVSCNISPVYVGKEAPEPAGYILVIKDLTALYGLWTATRKSMNTIRSIFEHSLDGIMIIGTDGVIRECSRGYEQITGLPCEQVAGRLVWDVVSSLFLPEQQTPDEYAKLQLEIRSKINRDRRGTVMRKIVNQVTEERKTVQVVYFPVNLDEEALVGVICRDVSKEFRSRELLRQSQQMLRENNELLESIMEAIPAALFVKNEQDEYTMCNGLFPKLAGCPKEQVIGKTANEIFPDAAGQMNEIDRKQLEETDVQPDMISFYHSGKEFIIYRNPVLHNGRKEGIVGVLLDVSELKRTEQQLVDERSRLQALGDHFPNGCLFRLEINNLTNHGAFTYLSKTCEQLTGLKVADLLQDADHILGNIYPEDLPLIMQSAKSTDGQNNFNARVRYLHPNGHTLWLRISAHRHDEGDFRIFDGFIIDITERKLAEMELERYREELEIMVRERTDELETANEELHAANEELQSANEELHVYREQLEQMVEQKTHEVIAGQQRLVSLSNHLTGGVIFQVTGAEPNTLRFSYLSAYFTELSGIGINDAMAQSKLFYDCIHPEDLIRFQRHHVRALRHGDPGIEFRIRNCRGEIKWIHMRANHHVTDDGMHVWDGFMLDISSQKEAETAMHLSQQTFRTVMENINSNIVVTDFDTHQILFANRKVKNDMGDKDIEGKICWKVLRAGNDGPCDNCPHPQLRDAQNNPTGIYKWEFHNILPGKWYECIDTAIEWVDGRMVHLQHAIDITQRKVAELELKRAKERAEEADRLKTAFLANISHEIRTPLNGIAGFLQFLTSGDISYELQQEYIRVVNSCSRQLIQLIEDVIDIAKFESNQLEIFPAVTGINRIMHDLLVSFEAELKLHGKGAIALLLDDTGFIQPGVTYVDPVRLRQVLFHLIANAIKFTRKGYVRFGYKLQPTGMLQFEVEDTGIGIPEEMYEAIFELFRQGEQGNNRFYRGTGIGLPIVQGLVQLMGGRVWLQSTVDKGSTFYFTIPYLPIAPGDAWYFDETAGHKTITSRPFAGKTVLLVEPGMLKYRYYEKLLATAGIHVVGVKDPKQWLDHICRCNIQAIVAGTAVIDDPNNDFAQEINSVHTDVPLVLLGKINDDRHRILGDDRNKIVVEEPAGYVQLMEAIGKML